MSHLILPHKNVSLEIMERITYLGTNLHARTELLRKIGFNQEFIRAVEKIKAELNIPEREESTPGQRIRFMEHPKVAKKSKGLVREFKLPESWEHNVRQYIVYDEFFFLHDPDVLSLETKMEKGDLEKKFNLRIWKCATKPCKDILAPFYYLERPVSVGVKIPTLPFRSIEIK